MDDKDIGNLIRSARRRKGMTQEELAKKAGLSTMSIRRYEQGERTIPDSTLKRIVDILGNSLEKREIILYGEPDNFNDPLTTLQRRKGASVTLDSSLVQKAVVLSLNQEKIMKAFYKLNPVGQDKVIDYAEDLASNSKYQRQQSPDKKDDEKN